MDVASEVAYCPSCSATVGEATRYRERSRRQGLEHARITGHVVQIADALTWEAVETLAGEPGLPLWERSSPN